jgi:hypothetical protein
MLFAYNDDVLYVAYVTRYYGCASFFRSFVYPGATDQYHRCRLSEGLYEAICDEIKVK